MRFRFFVLFAVLYQTASPSFAQRNLKDIPDPDPELERATFQVPEGFEVNLYAADPLLAKPIQINFDAQGRLWIASSEIYPQIKPGQAATDKIIVVEDTDHDGTANKTTVFADGLLIPTGVLPGDGGCYVANSTELVHFADTDGDGVADKERVVLSGFGTEDTHHILHTLRWGPDGALYMNQSIYIHSHIETPYGVRRMNGAGVWRFRPHTLELETFTLGGVNPWGHTWDNFGTSFQTDGAFGEGIHYLFPGYVGVTSPGAKRIVAGMNTGKPKLCSVEFIDGTHLPEDWRGNVIANDFRAHRVCRYQLGWENGVPNSQELGELIKSDHVAFRPIDVKMGPDGAIYIADWYNPIIQHGEVDFRDERRDHVHGRIWRITAKNRDLIPVLNLEAMSTSELVQLLASPEPWRKQQARIVLQDKGAAEVLPALNAWLDSLPSDHSEFERLQLEALWMCQSLDELNLPLLEKLLKANEPHVKAAAVRVLSHWQWDVPNSLDWLARLAQDPFARVRLEAVRALALSDSPEACELAMAALDLPVDRYLDFALWLTARDTQDHWLPALKNGEVDFGGNAQHLTFALQAIETPDVSAMLLSLLQQNNFPEVARANILRTVATTSVQPQELMKVLIECIDGPLPSAARADLLEALMAATDQKKLVPAGAHGKLQELESLVKPDEGRLAAAALKALGQWNAPNALDQLQNVLQNADYPAALQLAALDGLSRLPNQRGSESLQTTAEHADNSTLRIYAAARLVESNRAAGVATGIQLLSQLTGGEDPAELVRAILANRTATSEFAESLASQKVAADVAKLALRTIGSSGQQSPELTAAFRSAGGLDEAAGWNLTAEEKSQLLSEITENGDAAAGEQIFRRENLQCLKCHAIGSAGGQVGPELGSIGGSAQTDYLLESLLDPNAKIKENYHSLVVVDNSGKVISGIKVRETPTDLILRNAENQEIQIPLGSIDETEDGGSLMPKGLADELTRTELIHLVRFLSSLGKDPTYSLSTTAYLRNWQFMLNHHDTMQVARSGGAQSIAENSDKLLWQDRYSLVNGQIPLANVHDVLFAGSPKKTLRSRFETASVKSLRIDAQHVVSAWLDGKMVDANSPIPVPSGTHELILVLDGQKNVESFAAWLE